jgi:hypothetical protein
MPTTCRAPEGWAYSSGFINEDMLREHLLPAGPELTLLVLLLLLLLLLPAMLLLMMMMPHYEFDDVSGTIDTKSRTAAYVCHTVYQALH